MHICSFIFFFWYKIKENINTKEIHRRKTKQIISPAVWSTKIYNNRKHISSSETNSSMCVCVCIELTYMMISIKLPRMLSILCICTYIYARKMGQQAHPIRCSFFYVLRSKNILLAFGKVAVGGGCWYARLCIGIWFTIFFCCVDIFSRNNKMRERQYDKKKSGRINPIFHMRHSSIPCLFQNHTYKKKKKSFESFRHLRVHTER